MPIKEEKRAEVERAFADSLREAAALGVAVAQEVATAYDFELAGRLAVRAQEAFWDAYEPEPPTAYPWNPMEGK